MSTKNDYRGVIYESPDGGKTIYSRNIGEDTSKRVLFKSNEEQKIFIRWHKWREILQASIDNPSLLDAIEKAEVIYELSKNHDT